jgi:hypothetical protein
MVSATDILSGAIGLAAGAGLATLKYALAQRARLHEDLWGRRLDPYRQAWALTSQFSRWPRQSPTKEDLDSLHEQFRRWFYGDGGILMSSRARARYTYVQEGLEALCRRLTGEAHVDDADYDAMTEIMSGFRAALTGDLESRRKRSIIWALIDLRKDHGTNRDLGTRLGRLRQEVTRDS